MALGSSAAAGALKAPKPSSLASTSSTAAAAAGALKAPKPSSLASILASAGNASKAPKPSSLASASTAALRSSAAAGALKAPKSSLASKLLVIVLTIPSFGVSTRFPRSSLSTHWRASRRFPASHEEHASVAVQPAVFRVLGVAIVSRHSNLVSTLGHPALQCVRASPGTRTRGARARVSPSPPSPAVLPQPARPRIRFPKMIPFRIIFQT